MDLGSGSSSPSSLAIASPSGCARRGRRRPALPAAAREPLPPLMPNRVAPPRRRAAPRRRRDASAGCSRRTAAHARAGATARAGSELDGKKALIDQQLGDDDRASSTRSSELVRELEADRRKRSASSATSCSASTKGIDALSEHTQQLREALASSKARGQWGERMAEDVLRLARLPRRRQLPQAGDARRIAAAVPTTRSCCPTGSCMHMDVKFPLDNYVRYLEADNEVERKQLPRPVPPRRARPGEGAHDARLPRRGRRDRRLPAAVHPQRAGLRVHAGARPRRSSTTRCAHKIVLCSPLTLYAVLAVVRQAVDNFRLETHVERDPRAARRVLAAVGEVRRRSSRRCSSDSSGVAKEYAALDGHPPPRAAASARQDRARCATRSRRSSTPRSRRSRSEA